VEAEEKCRKYFYWVIVVAKSFRLLEVVYWVIVFNMSYILACLKKLFLEDEKLRYSSLLIGD